VAGVHTGPLLKSEIHYAVKSIGNPPEISQILECLGAYHACSRRKTALFFNFELSRDASIWLTAHSTSHPPRTHLVVPARRATAAATGVIAAASRSHTLFHTCTFFVIDCKKSHLNRRSEPDIKTTRIIGAQNVEPQIWMYS
jgi:hypothetical protein